MRLLTLTGTGGVGKTRLAFHIATILQPVFPHSIYFIPLAAFNESSQVISALTSAVGIQAANETSAIQHLKTFFASQPAFLVLDNFEHILHIAPLLTEFLEASSQLIILVTSQTVLRLSYEHEFPLAPLPLPDLTSPLDGEAAAQYASVALFVQRARIVRPDFQLTAENGLTIAEICVHLDGLPLAIELAAARIKLFTPQVLLTRLERRLHLLIGREQDRPARHQTLRANLDWSYHLLSPREQRLFCRLALFVGGCTLQAIEGTAPIAEGGQEWLLEDITSLLEKSLLSSTNQTNGEPRFFLLETIREYARECLEQSHELGACQTAYATYYLHFMEQAEAKLEGAEQAFWMERVERDLPNLRASLNWLLGQRKDQPASEEALRLVSVLSPFWIASGILREGRMFLEQALEGSETLNQSVRAEALMRLGHLLCVQGSFERAEQYLQESLMLARPLHFLKCIVASLNWLGYIALNRGDYSDVHLFIDEALLLARQGDFISSIAFALDTWSAVLCNQGEYEQATRLAQASLEYYQQTGNRGKIADATWLLGLLAYYQGDLSTAAAFYEECLLNYREARDKMGISWALCGLGFVVVFQKDYARARSLLEASLRLRQENGDQRCAFEHHALGLVAQGEGNSKAAYKHYRQSLTLFQEIGYQTSIIACLEGFAEVVLSLGQPFQAACVLGCAEALLQSINAIRPPIARISYEATVVMLCEQLGEQVFQGARQQGQRMKPDGILQLLAHDDASTIPSFAQEATPTDLLQPGTPTIVSSPPLQGATPTILPQPAMATAGSPQAPEELTERELEVFRLLASGLTKPQIARQLCISFHTVNAHVRSIYAKTSVSTRSAATRYAIEHRLV
ncbi:MAG TPA: tetratricopeptide repeat protein [Ktedonobacteraceae bacterium]|nr:tetratricopeptide repeat protein [Ktedonobacteraceae bacterium]